MPKFCKDCSHAMIKNGDVANAKCELAPRHDHTGDYLVTGIASEPVYSYCATARLDSQPCGPDGKLFEAKT